MTIPTGTGLNTALSGLQAYQAGIDTTGENISNANTAGYSRQVVNIGESTPETIGTGGHGTQVGTGATIENITRERDAYLDTDYRNQNQSSSYWSTMSDQLDQVQTAVGDGSSSGIGTALSSLYTAFNDLSQSNPSSSTASQAAVTGAAQTLISQFQSVQSQLASVQSQASAQLSALAGPNGQVQQDADQINQLNIQIKQQVQAGSTPNTLMDQRDQLLDDLSSLGQTTVVQDTNNDGGVSVYFGSSSQNNPPLVNSSTNAVTVPPVASYDKTSGGQLGALAEVAGGATTSGLSAQLTTLANDITSTVNGALGGAAAFSTDGNGSLSFNAGALSGVTQAQAAAAGQLTGSAPDQDYSAFVSSLGTAAQNASTSSTTATALTTSASNARQSVSGVSLDEEMANLITYQQGYEASARMLSTMDSVIQTLITSVGGAGL